VSKYPANWSLISRRIRLERAKGRCECTGECGRGRHKGRCKAVNKRPNPMTGSMVVLTVAHLNHKPHDCRPKNLKAMCQYCHLVHDLDQHLATLRRNRRPAR